MRPRSLARNCRTNFWIPSGKWALIESEIKKTVRYILISWHWFFNCIAYRIPKRHVQTRGLPHMTRVQYSEILTVRFQERLK